MHEQHTRHAEFSRERGLKLAQLGWKTAELATLTLTSIKFILMLEIKLLPLLKPERLYGLRLERRRKNVLSLNHD